MNNRVEQTQNWELRLNLLPLLLQRWDQNETMYDWTLMFQLECTLYSKCPAKYFYKFTNRRHLPWTQITMENLQSQEVIFYKNKKYMCKTWSQNYSNWKLSHQCNQVVTFYIKEVLGLLAEEMKWHNYILWGRIRPMKFQRITLFFFFIPLTLVSAHASSCCTAKTDKVWAGRQFLPSKDAYFCSTIEL